MPVFLHSKKCKVSEIFLWVGIYKSKAGLYEINILPQEISLGGKSVGEKRKEKTYYGQ